MESNPYSSPSANLYGSTSSGAEAVSQTAVSHLQRTKPWVQFMSVIAFLFAALMLLGAAFMLIMGVVGAAASASREMAGLQGGILIGMAAVYGLLGFLYIYPGVKLWKYGARIGDLVRTRSSSELESALNEQRALWKFLGILMIIMIVLWIGMVVVMGVVGAGFAGAMGNMQPR